MRIYKVRYDVIICMLLAGLVTWGAGKLAGSVLPMLYGSYAERHMVPEGEVGGKAGEDLIRVRSVEELLAQERFTVVAERSDFFGAGGGYHKGHYLRLFLLPSGEYVAAEINMDSAQPLEEEDDYGDYVLPAGRVVYDDLSKDETFLNQITGENSLTRTDFYVDMHGKGGRMSKEGYVTFGKLCVEFLAAIISFVLFHMIGSRIGVFPYILPPKKLRKQRAEERRKRGQAQK